MLSNKLPPELSFTVDIVGDETGEKFTGEFRYRRLTIKEKIQDVETWTSTMISSQNTAKTDSSIRSMYNILASLRFGIVSCPPWWKDSDCGLNLYDLNVVTEVMDKKAAAESSWKDKLKEIASTVKSAMVVEEIPQPE